MEFQQTFATNYLKHGGNVQNLQRLLSHVDLNTTIICDDALYMDYKQHFRQKNIAVRMINYSYRYFLFPIKRIML